MSRCNYLFAIGLLLCLQSAAQDTLQVNSDRPDVTDDTYIIQKGFLQLEQGAFFQRERMNQQAVNTYGLQDIAWRLGLAKKLEFEFFILAAQRYQQEFNLRETGIAASSLGLKYNISGQTGPLPEFSVLVNTTLPVFISEAFKSGHAEHSAALLFRHDLGRSEVGYNLSYSKETDMPTKWGYTVNYTSEFSRKWNAYLEQYANFQDREAEIGLGIGLCYSINHLLIVDIASDVILNGGARFYTVGFSYLIPHRFF